MKAIKEKRLREFIGNGNDNKKLTFSGLKLRLILENLLEEIDTLTVKEPDLIFAAEKYADKYEGDDRQDIKTDVLNAFYHGADWQRKKELAGNGNSEHKA